MTLASTCSAQESPNECYADPRKSESSPAPARWTGSPDRVPALTAVPIGGMIVRPFIVSLSAFLAAALVAFVSTASAITVSGTLGPQYGSPLVVQTTQSNAGALQQSSQIDFALASQLDMAYGYVSDGVLYLFFTGNLTFYWSLEGQTVWLPLDVFIDCSPGGQHQLLSNNPNLDVAYNLNQMVGLTFDTGFAADYWLSFGGNLGSWPHLQAYYATLPTAGGGTG